MMKQRTLRKTFGGASLEHWWGIFFHWWGKCPTSWTVKNALIYTNTAVQCSLYLSASLVQM